MELILPILMLPAFLLLDVLPRIFGLNSFSRWLHVRHHKSADKLTFILYPTLSVVIVVLLFLIF